jgi:hypothetical protein
MVKSLFNFLKKHLKVSKGDRQHSVVSIATLVGTSRVVAVSDEQQCLIVRHLQRRGRLIYRVRSDARYAMLCVPVGDKNKQFSKCKRTLR